MENKKQEEGRVRKSTPDKLNRKIDIQIQDNIKKYSKSRDIMTNRIKELDKEWGIERLLEINMSSLALTGITLTLLVNIYWIILPIIVLSFFVQHALLGWCPPLPIFRFYKRRTRGEIDKEKYSLKVLRGDFKGVIETTDEVYKAVSKD